MRKSLRWGLLLAALMQGTCLFAEEFEDQPPLDPETTAEEAVVTKQQQEEEKRLAKEKKAKEKADKKRKKNERTDAWLGVVYLPVRNYDVKSDGVEISLRGGTGSFNFFAVPEKGGAIPVLSGVDDSSSSFFSLLLDGVEYRLNHAAGCVPEVRELEASGQLAYTIAKKVQVVVDFSPFASATGGRKDMVRLIVYTTSLAEKPQTVALKALFDTILGENTDYHFSTASGEKIDSSRQFMPVGEERWITSSNGKTSAQFLLSGRRIAEPEAVSIANRDELYRSRWIPVIKQRNGFNGVLAYNNSAIALSWPSFVLEPEKTERLTLYIALAADGENPHGEDFLAEEADDEQNMLVSEEVTDNNGFVVRKPDVEFIVPPITDRQLDPAYIQQLIDRIESLQSDPKLVDRTEVRQLNAELDAILDKIRQQR